MVSHCSLLAGLFVVLVGCGGSSTDRASAGSSSDLSSAGTDGGVVSTLGAGVREIGALIEQKSNGNDYLVIEELTDAAFTARVGAVLTGTKRSAALLDCAVYGGGQSADPSVDEDFAKYIDHDDRVQIAAALDASIGTAKLHRIDSFGIGDIGDDYAARCTVAVEASTGKFLALQGHGNDSLL